MRNSPHHPSATGHDSPTSMYVDGHTFHGDSSPVWLNRQLCAVRRDIRQASDGYTVHRVEEALIGPGTTHINGGLRQAIEHLATERGEEIVWRQYSAPIRLLNEPLPAVVGGQRPTPHLADAIRHNERLLVRYDVGHVKLAVLLAEVVKSYPNANIAIAVASKRVRRELSVRLRRQQIEFDQSDRDHRPELGARLVLCSMQGAAHANVELNHRHIVVFPHATDAISVHGQDLLRTDNARFRLVGFLPYAKSISPYEQDLLAGVFGFNDVSVPLHGYDEAPVDIAWLPFRAPAAESSSEEKVSTLLRRGVWRHDGRNQLIVRLARALRAGRSVAAFPDLPAMVGNVSPARVAIVTATLVHAIEFARWLDDWAIVADPAARRESLSPQQQARLERASAGCSASDRYVIATLAGLRQLRPEGAEIFIWADSGCAGPLLPADHLVRPSGDSRRLTLIDMQDHHHPRLREWSEQRRRAYRSAEWLEPGNDAVIHRVRRFLARRGGR